MLFVGGWVGCGHFLLLTWFRVSFHVHIIFGVCEDGVFADVFSYFFCHDLYEML
jgi:hypothetical protein